MRVRDLLVLGLFVLIAFIAAAAVFLLSGQDGEQPEATSVAASTLAASPALTPKASVTQMHTPEPTPSATPSQTPEPAPTETPCVPAEGWVVYTVLPGETLFSIAARYGMGVAELQQANCLPSAGEIQAGQSLYVPWHITPTPTPCFPPASWVAYTVLPGETLYGIAARYGLTAGQVQQANCLSSAGTLRAGQDIYVPYLIPPTRAVPAPVTGGTGTGDTGGTESAVVTGLKEEIFFDTGGVFAEWPGCPIPGSSTPPPEITIMSGRQARSYHICAHGFPLGEVVTARLYDPAGRQVASRMYGAKLPNEDPTFSFDLWFPVGLEFGIWSIAARSATTVLTGTVEVTRPAEQTTNTMPEGDIDPFAMVASGKYSPGEAVVIRGASFEPNGVVRLGIYRLAESTDELDSSFGLLVRESTANTDAWGDFSTTVFVGASDPRGSKYFVIPITDPDAEWYNIFDPALSAYEVPR